MLNLAENLVFSETRFSRFSYTMNRNVDFSSCWWNQTLSVYSGAGNEHVAAFFQDRPIFVFSDNLGYSLLKNAWYPNLWPPCGGVWSNFIILSFMRKNSSRGEMGGGGSFFGLWPIFFWTGYVNYLKFGTKTATTIKVKEKFEQSMF